MSAPPDGESGESYYDYTAGQLESIGQRLGRSPRHVVLHDGAVVTGDESGTVLRRGDVLITEGSVAAVGVGLREEADPDAVVVNCRGTIIAPGFVDAHRHCWHGQLRRLLPDASLSDYRNAIGGCGIGEAYRPEDLYVGVLVGLVGALDAGITTVVDFSHNSPTSAHADAAFSAYRDAGGRAVHVSCPPETDRWEPEWPGELVRLRETHVDSNDLVTLRLGINMRRRLPASELVAMARDQGLAITFDAVAGDRPSAAELAQLSALGLLGPDINLTHCTALTAETWDVIADAGATVTLTPLSDEYFGIADAVPPVQTCIERDIRPAIGIDVENLPSDLFSQMRCLLSTQRMHATRDHYGSSGPAPRLLSTAEVLRMATLDGARSVGLDAVIGSIAPGKSADIIVIAAEDINNLPLNNPVGTVVLGSDPRNIAAVFVAGKLNKWNRELVNHDVGRIRSLARASIDHIVKASGYDPNLLWQAEDLSPRS